MIASQTVAQGVTPISFLIFLSSPGDVEPERAAVTRVVERLNAMGGDQPEFELIRWEDDYYTADSTFQEQIVHSSDCDIVICIFWKRLGSPLPDQYRRPDGTNPTGTEFEFEMAIEAASASEARMPTLLVYRKTTAVYFAERELDLERDQYERFKAFWGKWFRNEKAHFTAGFHTFDALEPFEEMVESHIRKWLRDRKKEVVWTEGSPFAGLRAFDADREAVFFGRSVETDRVRARFIANAIAGAKLLLVQGPSGSGKSSLVRAGVVPRLRIADLVTGLPDLDTVVEITPAGLVAEERDWPAGLASALFSEARLAAGLSTGDFPDAAALAKAIRDGHAGAAAVRGALSRMSAEAGRPLGLLLVLDQLEEVFDWTTAAATDLFRFLSALFSEGPVYAIATMRSEYQHRAAGLEPLAAMLGLGGLRNPDDPVATISLSPPTAADLREMIVAPAEAAGLVYEGADGDRPPLAHRIEEAARATALPALQLLLSELYERREGNVMTHAAHDALGGVSGVMANRGDAVLAESTPKERAAFPALARGLVRTGSESEPIVSSRLPLSRLDTNPAAAALSRRLMDAGLIVGDASSIRLAHEMLIDAWEQLRDLVAAERRRLVIRDRLGSQFTAYEEAGRRAGGLLVGLPLDEALELRDAWGPEALDAHREGLADYVRSSLAARRRKRLGFGMAGLAAVVLAAVLGWSVLERQRAQVAAQVRADLLAVAAEIRAGQQGYRQRAASRALAAMQAMATPETLAAGIAALMEQPAPHVDWPAPARPTAFGYRSDGALMSLDSDGSLFLNGEFAHPALSIVARPEVLEPLGDGGFIFATDDGGVGVWNAEAGLRWIRQAPDPPYVESIGSDQVAVARAGDGLTLWIARGGLAAPIEVRCRLAETPDCEASELGVLQGAVRIAASAQTGLLAAIVGATGRVLVHDGSAVTEVATLDQAESIAWYDDGALLGIGHGVAANVPPRISLWQSPALADEPGWRSVATIRTLPGARSSIRWQAVSPGNAQVAIPCAPTGAPSICVVDRETQAIDVLTAGEFGAESTRWSPDGTRLTALLRGGGLRSWDLTAEWPAHTVMAAYPDPLTALASGVGTGRIAVGTEAGDVILSENGPDTAFNLGEGRVEHLAFRPGAELAAAQAAGVWFIDDATARLIAKSQGTAFLRVAPLTDGGLAATQANGNLVLWDEPAAGNGAAGTAIPGRFGGIAGDAAGGLLATGPRGQILRITGGASAPVFDPPVAEDISMGLSLDLHPNGRDLAVTRGDGGARIFDVEAERASMLLPTAELDTKVVRFSPDGTRIAVLGAQGYLYVWSIDLARRTAELRLSMQPVPDSIQSDEWGRPAVWIDWLTDAEIAVATSAGLLLKVPVDRALVQSRLAVAAGEE